MFFVVICCDDRKIRIITCSCKLRTLFKILCFIERQVGQSTYPQQTSQCSRQAETPRPTTKVVTRDYNFCKWLMALQNLGGNRVRRLLVGLSGRHVVVELNGAHTRGNKSSSVHLPPPFPVTSSPRYPFHLSKLPSAHCFQGFCTQVSELCDHRSLSL